MDISHLEQDQQEEFRRLFPEMFTEIIPTIEENSEEVIIEEGLATVIGDIGVVINDEGLFEDVNTSFSDEIFEVREEVPVLIEEEVPTTVIIEEPVPINYTRFQGLSWFGIVNKQQVILAGLGGIGSYVSFLLSRLGVDRLILYDDDRFEFHNLAGQLVDKHSVGQSKVEVAAHISHKFSNYIPTIFPTKFTEESTVSNIMICGFDNMEARKVFFKKWKELVDASEEPFSCLFIDGRLLAEEFQIFCLRGDDKVIIDYYEREHLFDDSEVKEADCSMKQTSHYAAMIASKMVAYFTNFCNNLSPSNPPRRVPYYYHYNGILDTYDTKY